MAEVLDVFGKKVIGKAGPVSFFISRGKTIMRSLPGKRSGPSTEKQLLNQHRFKAIRLFCAPFKDVVIPQIWNGMATTSSGYHLFMKTNSPAFDPEGIFSTPGAIVEVIFGYLVGNYIITKGKTHEMLTGLFVAGCVLIVTGFFWDMFFPINKKIWTSSYAVYTSGLAILVLSVLIYLMEFRNQKGFITRFFDVFGKNALFIFVLSGILPRLSGLIRIPAGDINGKERFLSAFGWFYEKVCKPLFSEEKNASLMYAICFIIMMWFLAWLLDRKRIYIRV